MKSRYAPLIIAALVAIVLVFTVDDFVRQVIVSPMLYVSWFVSIFVSSMPQQVFWGVFILVALFFAAKSITREQKRKQQTQSYGASQRGPVATWTSLLERADKQDFSRWRLAQALRKLTLDTLVSDEPRKHQQPKGQHENGRPALPPEIEAYFEAPMPAAQGFSRFWPLRQANQGSSALNLDPERVVEHLENELDPLLGE